MTKFTLTEITKTQVGRREEDTYLYTGEDGTKVKFHAGSEAWTWSITTFPGTTQIEGRQVVEAFVDAGMRQHAFPSFEDAIRELEIS